MKNTFWWSKMANVWKWSLFVKLVTHNVVGLTGSGGFWRPLRAEMLHKQQHHHLVLCYKAKQQSKSVSCNENGTKERPEDPVGFMIAMFKVYWIIINVIMIYWRENVCGATSKLKRKPALTFASNPNAVNPGLLWGKEKAELIHLAWHHSAC